MAECTWFAVLWWLLSSPSNSSGGACLYWLRRHLDPKKLEENNPLYACLAKLLKTPGGMGTVITSVVRLSLVPGELDSLYFLSLIDPAHIFISIRTSCDSDDGVAESESLGRLFRAILFNNILMILAVALHYRYVSTYSFVSVNRYLF